MFLHIFIGLSPGAGGGGVAGGVARHPRLGVHVHLATGSGFDQTVGLHFCLFFGTKLRVDLVGHVGEVRLVLPQGLVPLPGI